MEKYIDKWKPVKNELLADNVVSEMVVGEFMTMCRYNINKHTIVPEHSHEYEQIVYIIEGEMILTVDGNQIHMRSGDVYVLLGNVKHAAEIVSVPFQTIETYSPPRLDLA